MKSWTGSLLSRLVSGAPACPADGVIRACAVALPIGLVWSLVMSYTMDRWDAFQFFDPDTLQLAFLLKSYVVLPGWGLLLGLAFWARRYSPDNRWLPYAAAQFFAVVQVLMSCLMGHYTALFAAMSLFTGASLGLLFFETRVVRAGVYTFVAMIALTTVAEQLHWIPYAPLFAQPPYAGGQLNTGWLLSFGSLSFALLILAALVLVAAVQHARDQAAQLKRATSLISRYLPGRLAERILAGQHPARSKPERRKLTVFFSDVVGFTKAADEMEAEDLVALLNEYLAEMAAIAEQFGTTINQFVGDGLMIIFGAPEPGDDRDNALQAVRMALAMQQRMEELQQHWFNSGIQRPFRIRIGINTGVSSVGDYGSEGRSTYSAIGTQTNLAARIQEFCQPGGVLISHTTWALVNGEFDCQPRGEIEARGLHYPVRIYTVDAGQPNDSVKPIAAAESLALPVA